MHSYRNPIIGSIVGLLLTVMVVQAAPPDMAPPRQFPTLNLPAESRGATAIRALGEHLPAVAKAYGLTAAELSARLTQDRHLVVDKQGRLFYADDFGVPPQPAAAGDPAEVAAGTPYTLEQTFLMHSRAGAKRVIYLDFDGHILSGTAWNNGYNGGANITCPAWNIDGNASSFGVDERTIIQQIWERVAEDYRGYDVDVTTEFPGDAAMTRSSSTDDVYGTRVLISAISSYFGNYGGIAYVGVYNYVGDFYKPALVFPERLSNAAKYIAEAASHEAGHNLGLGHDGTTTGSAYYLGHGSGETGWAPIMGAGYYQNLTQWSKGEYANANNQEDDLVIIQSYGLAYRADDVGNTVTSAGFLVAGAQLSGAGVLDRNNDVDVFGISAGAGNLAITVAPAAVGPNADLVAELRTGTGTLLALANPTAALGATLNATVAAGTYYLHVRGTGVGDPLGTGYSIYGCIGEYIISGSVVDPSGQVAPVAVASANTVSGTAPLTVQFNGSNSFDQDGTITSYAWNFGDGSSAAGTNVQHTYSSAGSYTAVLTVTDNSNLTNSDSVSVTVAPPNTNNLLRVSSIQLTLVSVPGGKQVQARVVVTDPNNNPISGASVTGSWSGAVTGTSSGTTSTNGGVDLLSKKFKRGTVTFRVTGIAKSGYAYAPAQNLITQASITQ